MMCDICKKNPATVFLTQMAEGKAKKFDLCEACSKDKGVDDPAGFALADLLLGLGDSQEVEKAASGEDASCPSCGFTHADFKKAGRFGCSECYKVFADGLESLLKTMHRGTRHKGKVPRRLQDAHQLSEKLVSMQKRLDAAIKSEDYETAARLRDELKALKAKPAPNVAKA